MHPEKKEFPVLSEEGPPHDLVKEKLSPGVRGSLRVYLPAIDSAPSFLIFLFA
jgi:hypothetical protein